MMMLPYNEGAIAIVLSIIYQCISIVSLQNCPNRSINTHEEVYTWFKSVDFVWPNRTFAAQAKRRNRNELGVPIGIKVYQSRIYLTIPRWSGNTKIPVNLAWVFKGGLGVDCSKRRGPTSPKLRYG